MSLFTALAVLAVPLVIGLLAGRLQLFADTRAAIGALNRYALYIAFPLLVVFGMLHRELAWPEGPGFFLVVPVVAGALAVLLAGLRRTSLGVEAGPVALTSLFANTAYVGLPLVEQLLGGEALGLGALAVAMHVTVAMALGPSLLLAWRGQGVTAGAVLGKVARQPLAWSPVVGLVLLAVPGSGAITPFIEPVARSASPVGLFLIGLFIAEHGRGLRFGAGAWLRAASKLVLVPALTFGALALFGVSGMEAGVLLLLSLMPTAVASFSLAHELDEAVEEVTAAIVLSTALCPVSIGVAASYL